MNWSLYGLIYKFFRRKLGSLEGKLPLPPSQMKPCRLLPAEAEATATIQYIPLSVSAEGEEGRLRSSRAGAVSSVEVRATVLPSRLNIQGV